MKAFQKAVAPALQVELPMALATGSNPDPSVGEEYQKANLDLAVGEGARSLDLKAARILWEAVVAMWKVHWLQEILMMKSMQMFSHFHSGMLKGCRLPEGLKWSALILRQVSHLDTYFAISRFILVH
jgi:hypothetical protein